jgi:F0F1-type ATP synthase membrane subunit c/vacuolar-type H+-ATPase subunit K
MDGSEDLRRTYRETAIVSGALGASTLIYAVIVEVLRTRARLPPGGAGAAVNVAVLRYAFYFLAGVEGLAIPFVRRAVEAGPALRGSLLARLRTGSIVGAALAEVPAILGLVLFLLAGARADFYALAGWSLVLQLFHFPRYERWEESARTAARQHG